jgi:3-deoxy-7-phosphoheptulonate synthase
VNEDGLASVVRTPGNPHTHVVLRGDKSGPNHSRAHVASVAHKLADAGLEPRLMIDCSHDNSLRDHRNQLAVVENVAAQVAHGNGTLIGVMIESHLLAGRQDLTSCQLTYGQSITDACVDFATTETMLSRLAQAVRSRRQSHVRSDACQQNAIDAG